MRGALSGFTAWLLQRASAMYMLVFFVLVPLSIWQQGVNDYNAWRTLLAEPVMALMWALFFLALTIHTWIGVRDILIDYAHNIVLRMSLLALLAVLLVIMMLWALGVLLLNSGVSA